ncbi:Menin [Frankliniella fusca]|uniref:Menin n=1 Tax=Frankliniella fusca TaxID=407009 RepID=A0AAE1H488_9NEOP|nr:Menin [Frankliniella fusca]
MAGLERVNRQLFPLRDISSVVQVFTDEVEKSTEPDLALLSIVSGAVENSLTCNRSPVMKETLAEEDDDSGGEFEIEYHIVDALYSQFRSIILGSVDLSAYGDSKYATRELVKKVSDVIWNSLSRSYYKDRAHLQSIYSYLTGNKLDCFGVALAVVAGCQVLGFNDVHLALSEDHAWVVFGENGQETAEVTWHGKGNEDKRGQPIGRGVGSLSWLYVKGQPVICDRYMEVTALVSSINPSFNMTTDIKEVADFQQQLMWMLYDRGYLERYPMALGNLGDLEEINPTSGRPHCSDLFAQAVDASRKYYNNQHVYPYTYQGGYYFRQKMYKEALESWANAADVLREYNYSRDDEELYKELMDIANELIPHVMKAVGSGIDAHSILKDPECFAHLLRLYDGICQWEEGSVTPVLHIGWAKPLVNTIAKFDASVRAQLVIDLQDDLDEEHSSEKEEKVTGKTVPSDSGNVEEKTEEPSKVGDNLNNNNYTKALENECAPRNGSSSGTVHPSIEALTAACSEKILNPDFLLQGDGEPFVAGGKDDLPADIPEVDSGLTKLVGKKMGSNGFHSATSSTTTESTPIPAKLEIKRKSNVNFVSGLLHTEDGRPKLTLGSRKMCGLKDLLLSEKLNTQAISLQLTAQSQVQVGRKTRSGAQDVSGGSRPKRTRRE